MSQLRFTGLPQHPNQTELDAIMRDVSAQLGETWTASRMDGYWLFYRGHPGVAGPIISGAQFIVALGYSTGCTVINEISF